MFHRVYIKKVRKYFIFFGFRLKMCIFVEIYNKMENREALKEIAGFENKSNFSNKMTIVLYTVLKSLNNETSYLVLSLMSTFLACFIFDFSYFFGLITHFTVWTLFRSKFIDRDKYKKENSDIDLIIDTIKNHLNKKSEK